MAREVIYHRPWLYGKQKRAIFCEERYGVVEASTKSGKTVGCMAWIFEQALLNGGPNRHYWWVAPVYKQARVPFRRFHHADIPPELYTSNKSDLTITLANGAVIGFHGSDRPDDLYGEDVYAAVIDEASRCKEEAWHAVRSTLTKTGGPVRIIGNVRGRKNWAYRLARRAETGEPDMHYAKITAWDAVEAGVLEASEIEDARRQVPEAVFRQLYLAEAADDEGNPFGVQAIRDCIAPLTKGPPVCWGWDLARHENWTVGIALDRHGQVCRLERDRMPWGETLRWIRRASGAHPAAVDSTGAGDMPAETLERTSGEQFEPFRFTSRSKQHLMERLAVAIQDRSITFPDGPITAELEAFEYEHTRTGVRYTAPEGMHDDCVDALALAVYKWDDVARHHGAREQVYEYAGTGGFVL